jgi:hypothetical protein
LRASLGGEVVPLIYRIDAPFATGKNCKRRGFIGEIELIRKHGLDGRAFAN